MHAAGLGEDIFAHQGHVGRDAHAGDGLHIPAHVHQGTLLQGVFQVQVVVQDAQGAGQGQVAGPFSQAVHRGVDALHAGLQGLYAVGGRQVVVVVGVEVEVKGGVALHHPAAEVGGLPGAQYPQRIRQHEALHGSVLQVVHQEVHIFRGVEHSVGPVLQVQVHREAFPAGQFQFPQDVFQMLLRGFPQLPVQVAEGTLGKEVHALAPHAGNPVHGGSVVHESQYLHLAQMAAGGSPVADFGTGIPFAGRHAGRPHLNPVHLQLLQQQAGNGQLLVGIERDTGGLLPVPEGGIHHFHHKAFRS